MKLLHIIAEMNPVMGGVCQAVRTLVSGLTSLGVYNEVVSLDAPDANFLVNDDFVIHALGPGKGPWFYNSALLPWLKENLTRFNAVIVHGLWQYHGYASIKALKYLRTHQSHSPKILLPKLFVMPHGMLDPYFQRAAGRKLKAIRNSIYWRIAESQLINAATLLFTCEEEKLLAAIPFRPYHPKNVVVVGLGVAQPPPYTDGMREAFLAACPEFKTQPYLLFLSRIHEKKGTDLLLKSYERLLNNTVAEVTNLTVSGDKLPESKNTKLPKLIVAGPGIDTAYGQSQKQLVANSPTLQSQISFPGMLTGEAKWGAFYGCEAFVLPSHQENFGIAVVEALACGKPVLISNQVNIWREITDTNSGLVADDTLVGTQQLLEQWQHMSKEKKVIMQEQAFKTFTRCFAIEPASRRFLSAIADSDK